MRLAYVPDSFPQVSETFIMNEIYWFVKRGYEITVVPRVAGPQESWIRSDRAMALRLQIKVDTDLGKCSLCLLPASLFRARNVWGGKHPRAILNHLQGALSVTEHALRIARNLPDVIICHFGFDNAISAVLAGKKLGVPVILWLHGSDLYTAPHRNLQWISDNTTTIITNSQYSYNLIRELGVQQRIVIARDWR